MIHPHTATEFTICNEMWTIGVFFYRVPMEEVETLIFSNDLYELLISLKLRLSPVRKVTDGYIYVLTGIEKYPSQCRKQIISCCCSYWADILKLLRETSEEQKLRGCEFWIPLFRLVEVTKFQLQLPVDLSWVGAPGWVKWPPGHHCHGAGGVNWYMFGGWRGGLVRGAREGWHGKVTSNPGIKATCQYRGSCASGPHTVIHQIRTSSPTSLYRLDSRSIPPCLEILTITCGIWEDHLWHTENF